MKFKHKHKILILIVEDNELNFQMYRELFEQKGFEAVVLPHADGFFPEEVSKIEPDIISMDIMLGKDGVQRERDGLEAIAALKADLRTHDIPVFVLTNFFEETKVNRAKELGVVDFIFLPGQTITKIPELFSTYLKDPKHYKPSHPSFRK